MGLRALLSCFAVVAITTSLSEHVLRSFADRSLRSSISMGLLFGLGALASMALPCYAQNGFLMDLRAPLLAAPAFLGGPVSAAIAASVALAYRAFLGGAGMWAGCANIVLVGAVALVGRASTGGRPAGPLRLAGLSLAVCAVTPILSVVVSNAHFESNFKEIGSLALLSFGSTWVVLLSLQRSERHKALLHQDTLYRSIIEALPDSLCAKDTESRFIGANPATARLMNVPAPIDLIGKTDADFYPPDMAKLFREEELKVLSNAVVGPLDQEVRFPDGTTRWLTSMKTPLLDEAGRVTGIITHNRDVTDRKALEAELRKTQGYLQEAMNNMADGLVLYDREGTIRFCNQQYTNMFPKTADLRVAGARFCDIIRASVLRGEEGPKPDIDAYVAERVRLLPKSGERLLELLDGRSIELRSRLLPGSDTLIVFTDVTAKKQLERELERRASQDPLTRLANRAAFEFELDAVHRHAVQTASPYAVMMLDLDRFKPINDTFGHAVGDQLLVEIADRLRAVVEDRALVARLGGDEFALLVVAQDIETATIRLAHRLVKRLRRPFRTGEVDLTPSGSLGIAHFPQDAEEPFELLRLADKALYAVKTRGGGAWAMAAVEAELRGSAKTKPPAQSVA